MTRESNKNVNQAYDAGYIAAIKDLRDTIKQLSSEYDKAIPISHLKAELNEMNQRYLGFIKAK